MANGTIEKIAEQSAQSRFTDDTGGMLVSGGVSLLTGLIRAGELLPTWWSRTRDVELFKFFMASSNLQAAEYKIRTKLVSVKPKVIPRDTNIKSHIALADEFNTILYENWELGQGWQTGFEKDLVDYFTKDNGFFREITGDGPKDKEIRGMPTGSISLDSTRCTRTSDPIYPVVYYDTDGQKYKFHRSRIMFAAQSPSTIARMNGIGRCWVTRCVDYAQNMIDILTYKQEKLGSRPLRQMLIGQGMTASQIWEAVVSANESMDNSALRRFAQTVVIGSQSTNVDLKQIDLANIPDGFDEKTSTELAMFAIALAAGIPPRDLWPASTTGATKADAETQHISGSSGYQAVLDTFAFLIGGSPVGSKQNIQGKFLPASLKLVFDFVDDEQDSRHAENSRIRSETRERDINDGVITVRVARQQALNDGDLTDSQYEELELNDGRLPDGTSVLNLFLSTEPAIQDLLNISTPNPLDVDANAENAEFIIEQIQEAKLLATTQAVNASTGKQRSQGRQAVRALTELERLYRDVNKPEEFEANENVADEAIEEDQEDKEIDFTPPKGVQAAAKRGLELRKKFGRGGLSRSEASEQGIGSGVQRATNLANGDKVSPKTINRMVSFFARHERNKDSRTEDGEPGAGMIAWLLWGGDPGKTWANKIKRQMEKEDKALSGLTEQEIISMAPFPAQQANYRKANKDDLVNGRRCSGCKFNEVDQNCSLFEFCFTRGFTCDKYENRVTGNILRRAYNQIRLR